MYIDITQLYSHRDVHAHIDYTTVPKQRCVDIQFIQLYLYRDMHIHADFTGVHAHTVYTIVPIQRYACTYRFHKCTHTWLLHAHTDYRTVTTQMCMHIQIIQLYSQRFACTYTLRNCNKTEMCMHILYPLAIIIYKVYKTYVYSPVLLVSMLDH